MKYLIDTNVFLRVLEGSEKVRPHVREIISNDRGAFCISAGSVWEIGLKYSIGRLPLPDTPSRFLPEALQKWGLAVLSITQTHALAVSELPWHHKDPFDRMLVAQAKVEELTIVTTDKMLEKYGINMVWAGK